MEYNSPYTLIYFALLQDSIASIPSVLSDSSTWNVHVNNLSALPPASDNIAQDEHEQALYLLKPVDDIIASSSDGANAYDEQVHSTQESQVNWSKSLRKLAHAINRDFFILKT